MEANGKRPYSDVYGTPNGSSAGEEIELQSEEMVPVNFSVPELYCVRPFSWSVGVFLASELSDARETTSPRLLHDAKMIAANHIQHYDERIFISGRATVDQSPSHAGEMCNVFHATLS